jgi:hypothetical protein
MRGELVGDAGDQERLPRAVECSHRCGDSSPHLLATPHGSGQQASLPGLYAVVPDASKGEPKSGYRSIVHHRSFALAVRAVHQSGEEAGPIQGNATVPCPPVSVPPRM